MAKKKKNSDILIGSIIVSLLMVWLALPVIAGLFKVGEPGGPKIYPEKLHITLYGLGYRAAGHGEPHSSISAWIYTRPWFYFMKPKPIPQEKAEAVTDWLRGKCE
jgi:hypothetical protein